MRIIPAQIACSVMLLAFGIPAAVAAGPESSFEAQLLAIQQDWAVATYRTPAGDTRLRALESLASRAEALAAHNPRRAEALVWQGIVLSSEAGAKGGLGALALAKQAREKLQAAIDLSPGALDGSAYTSLATLYAKVPGFPLGFGSDKKARELFDRALAINPDGIDPNYFYGEFLLGEGEYAAAVRHLEHALQAPSRPGRELADTGRRDEARALLAEARAKAG